jgi:hypothetical protein
LADPQFHKPQQIDMLLEAEIFFDIWTARHLKLQQNEQTLQETLFGWVLAGKLTSTSNKSTSLVSTFCGCGSPLYDNLSDLVKRFWEIESCQADSNLVVEEKQVEEHFLNTHRRTEYGRDIPTNKTNN